MHPEVRQEGPGSCPKCGMALEPVAPTAAVTKTEWTCPMHPEIVRDAPGSCPMCGMALEPKTVTAEEEENPELIDMTRRFKVCVVLTIPLVIIAMRHMVPGLSALDNLLSPALHEVAGTYSCNTGGPMGGLAFFCQGLAVGHSPGIRICLPLSGLVLVLPISYSIVAALFPGLFPASFRGEGGEVSVYFEAAAAITVLVLLGQVMELRARTRTGAAIKALLGLAPKTARRIKDGNEEDVPLELIRAGDLLRVRPGEKIPVDGTVTEGSSSGG